MVELVPPVLDFGVVAHGENEELELVLKNVGSGPCTFVSAKLTDCSSFAAEPPVCSSSVVFSSSTYKITQMPSNVPDGLPPGGELSFTVRFTPPPQGSAFDVEDHPALFRVTYKEKSSNPGSWLSHELPEACAADGECPPNVLGGSGTPHVAVAPDVTDFGAITVGCASPARKVALTNQGSAPLTVDAVAIDPACPSASEFVLQELPALPTLVSPEGSLAVEVSYGPENSGTDECALLVTTQDPAAPAKTVLLRGEGTFATEQTDVFVQPSGQAVDVLIVVDSSGSMAEERDRLANGLHALVEGTALGAGDYQVALMGLSLDPDPECTNTGVFQGPGVLHNQTTGLAATILALDAGGCAPDAAEGGLEAMRLALTWPRVEVAPNAGFLRDDAALEVIVVADEEDQSPAPVGFYVLWLKSLKGAANVGLVHLNALVGDPVTGCEAPNGADQAEAGDRYVAAQQATGGVFASICGIDYAGALASIGNAIHAPKRQVVLSGPADPATLSVWVDDVECSPLAWAYDAPGNSIVFDDGTACTPAPGDTIKVLYQALCLGP